MEDHLEQIDPILQDSDGKWWYWNIDFMETTGPFDTEAEAKEEFATYYKESTGSDWVEQAD